MKNLYRALLIIFVLSGLALAQDRPVRAVIVETSGQARLQHYGEKPVAVEPLMQVYEGTALEVKAGGLVEAYSVLDGRRYEAIGPCTIRAGKGGAEILKGRKDCVRWIESAGKGDLVDPSHLPQRGLQDKQLKLNFVSTKDSLTFSWETGLPGPYWIRVFTAREGEVEKVWWSTMTDKSEIRYSGPPLEQDRSYVWQVAAGKTLSSARFRVYSGGALDSFQRAESELEAWGKAHPDDPAVHVVMALMYDQNDQPQKALEALQQAKRRQTSKVHQQALDLRMSQLMQETSTRARSQFNPFNPNYLGTGYVAPGYVGNWNWGYPGWGAFGPRWF
jgi:hypothetical protein